MKFFFTIIVLVFFILNLFYGINAAVIGKISGIVNLGAVTLIAYVFVVKPVLKKLPR